MITRKPLFLFYIFLNLLSSVGFASKYFSKELIDEINLRPYPELHKKLVDLPQFEDEGTLLYPLSGVDISFPVRMFPNITTFVGSGPNSLDSFSGKFC